MRGVYMMGEEEHSLRETPPAIVWEIGFDLARDRGRVDVFKIAVSILTCLLHDCYREDNLRIMRLFETCMLAAYDTFTTKRGYVTVKLNEKKAKRIRFNQKVRDIFEPVKKVFAAKKGNGVVDIEDFVF